MAVEERDLTVLPTAVPANAAPSVPALFQPRSLGEAVKFAQFIAQSKMIPASYQGKPEDIIVCWQFCEELGLSLQQGLNGIAVINGRTSIFGDLAIALVRRSPLCEYVYEEMEGDGDSLTAVCIAKRRGQGERTVRFSVADAKKAGLWGKSGPWTNYPKRMLQFRARGFCLRDLFPDVLKGLITTEEARDYPSEDVAFEVHPEPARPAPMAPRAATPAPAREDPFAIPDERPPAVTANGKPVGCTCIGPVHRANAPRCALNHVTAQEQSPEATPGQLPIGDEMESGA